MRVAIVGGTERLGQSVAHEQCARGHDVRVQSRHRIDLVSARDLARSWRAQHRRRALLLPLPVPSRIGQPLRDGALTANHPHVRGSIHWAARSPESRSTDGLVMRNPTEINKE